MSVLVVVLLLLLNGGTTLRTSFWWPFALRNYPGRKRVTVNLPEANFTLHGMWPQTSNRRHMVCNSKTRFRSADVNNLMPKLRIKWPNAYQPGTRNENEWFWRHEWKDHGICSDPMFNVTEYFDLGLYAIELLNLLEHINPRDTRLSTPDFDNALLIPSGTGPIFPFVRCMPGRSNPYVLQELYYCFNSTSKQLFDYPGGLNSNLSAKCPDTRGAPSSPVNIQFAKIV